MIRFQWYMNHHKKASLKHIKEWNLAGVPNIFNVLRKYKKNNQIKKISACDEVLYILKMRPKYDLGNMMHITVDDNKNI